MQFFLFDFALAFVALLGYRTLVAVTRYWTPAVSLERGVKPQSRPRLAPRREIERPRRRVEPQPGSPARRGDVSRASLHRLINFW